MLNSNRMKPPRAEELDHETDVWDRLRAEANRRSTVHASGRIGDDSDAVYLEYDDDELAEALRHEEPRASAGHSRAAPSMSLGRTSSRASAARSAYTPAPIQATAPLSRDAFFPEPVRRSSVPPPPTSAYASAPAPRSSFLPEAPARSPFDAPMSARASHVSLPSYAGAPDPALRTGNPAPFMHAAAPAFGRPQASYHLPGEAAQLATPVPSQFDHQAWADQFEVPPPATTPVEPTWYRRSRWLLPAVGLVTLLGLGGASYQLVVVPRQQQEQAALEGMRARQAKLLEEQRAAEQAAARAAEQQAADEAARAAEEAAKLAGQQPAQQDEPAARIGHDDPRISKAARRERMREERRELRRERRREARRAARAERRRGRAVTESRDSDSDPLRDI